MGLDKEELILNFRVKGQDFQAAGLAASQIRHVLKQVGFDPQIIRRAGIAAYEAEMNIVIHAYGGILSARVTPREIEIVAQDEGPGIDDIELAMKEGYSTAPPEVREMGFGAGMGLPNIKRCADTLEIVSEVGRGTTLRARIFTRQS